MFESGFPPYWSTLKKLVWLIGSGVIGGTKWTTLTGSIVSFVAKKVASILGLTVTITPQQDLHGQDAPYPAGGKGNIFDGVVEIGGISTSTGGNIDQTDRQRTKNYIPVSESTDYYFYRSTVAGHFIYCYDSSKVLQSYYDLGSSNGVFTTPEGTAFIRFVIRSTELTENVAVNYPSTITTYSPYSNICPITGWTGCEVNVTGVNLWDEEWEIGSYSDTTGEKISGTRFINKNRISIKPNTSYYLKLWSGATNDMRILYYDANGSYLEITGWIYQGEFTTPADAYYMNFFLAGSYGTTYNNDISINYPSTDTDYHAYQGTTLSVTFPDGQTVYGGTLDFVSGVLTVTYKEVDLGTKYWTKESGTNYKFFYSDSSDKASNWHFMCSQYKAVQKIRTKLANCEVGLYYNEGNYWKRFVIRDDSFTDLTANEFKTAMSGVQMVYELAEPIEIQLTPQQINTLVGQNNIFGTGTSVSVTIPQNIIVEGT